MKESTTKTMYKQIEFEKTGETLSICVTINNISPSNSKDTILGFLDTLYEKIKGEMCL